MEDLTGKGIVAYDFVVTFDPTVVQWDDVPFDTTDTLSRSLTITTNTSTPGRLVISAFGTEALSGAGPLLKLKGQVIGTAGTSTPLTWHAFHFNEGWPTVTTTNSHFTVTPPARPLRTSPRRKTPERRR